MKKRVFWLLAVILVFLVRRCSFFAFTSKTVEVENDKTPVYNDLYFMGLKGNVRVICENERFYENILVKENDEKHYENQSRNEGRCYFFDPNG